MARLVTFAEPLEGRVRFVEETPPAEIVEATLARLENGDSGNELLAAAGLAVSRSTELPMLHHGGPVHPVAGLHAIAGIASRLAGGDAALLPAVQSVALANKHIHAPEMGPGAMPEMIPSELDGTDKATLLAGFAEALAARVTPTAERHLLALLKVAEPGEIMEAMLAVALPRNALDDHYFLYLVYAFRALDDLGWEHAPVLLRPPLRFLVRHPKLEPPPGERGRIIADGIALYHDYPALEALIDDAGLGTRTLRLATGDDETAAIEALAEHIATSDAASATPAPLAAALAGGLSVMGTCEALSIGAARRFLRSRSGNPFDVHYHTGVDTRRYLLGLPGLTQRTRLLALVSWGQGYEVRHLDRTLHWPADAAPAPTAAPEALLGAIAESVAAQPTFDLFSLTGSIADMVAPESVRETVALARAYAETGADATPFFALMAELVCRDDQSEMHAYKLQQAAYEEYHACREPLRQVHLLAAAKHAATVARLRPRSVYPRARALLDG